MSATYSCISHISNIFLDKINEKSRIFHGYVSQCIRELWYCYRWLTSCFYRELWYCYKYECRAPCTCQGIWFSLVQQVYYLYPLLFVNQNSKSLSLIAHEVEATHPYVLVISYIKSLSLKVWDLNYDHPLHGGNFCADWPATTPHLTSRSNVA